MTRGTDVDGLHEAKRVSEAKLYNLATDIGEATDLADKMPEKVQELQARWDKWDATLAKPLWGGGGGEAKAANKKRKK